MRDAAKEQMDEVVKIYSAKILGRREDGLKKVFHLAFDRLPKICMSVQPDAEGEPYWQAAWVGVHDAFYGQKGDTAVMALSRLLFSTTMGPATMARTILQLPDKEA